MYRAYKLEGEIDFPEGSLEAGIELRKTSAKFVEVALKEFVSGGKIDGSRLRDHWFKEVKADIFISHSHLDQDIAVSLAGWLHETFALKAFIDSTVWGYSTDLLRDLDDEFAPNHDGTAYDYATRNVTTSHVHMMLATSLSRMMDVTECAIFVSTPNSVSHSKGSDALVDSPWIFYELDQLSILRRKEPVRTVKKASIEENFASKDPHIPIRYKANFESLTPLGENGLVKWVENWRDPAQEGTELEHLYRIPYIELI